MIERKLPQLVLLRGARQRKVFVIMLPCLLVLVAK